MTYYKAKELFNKVDNYSLSHIEIHRKLIELHKLISSYNNYLNVDKWAEKVSSSAHEIARFRESFNCLAEFAKENNLFDKKKDAN